jgi:Inner centromere protein, ARK binding region
MITYRIDTVCSSRPRKRPKLPIPGWAMSPELKIALEEQCTLNPEEIFGKMAPLRIEGEFCLLLLFRDD